jgi:hypothetical protein
LHKKMADYSGGFRIAPYPTVYGDLRSAWSFDMEITGIGVGYFLTSICMLLVLPTLRRKTECMFWWGGFFYLWIGGSILISAYGHGWVEGQITTRTQYISNSNLFVNANLGLHVGLRGINVTMLGVPEIQANHTINYNERFWWGGEDVMLPQLSWLQGKDGFGPYAGQINQEYKKNLERGVPHAIMWIAEWFIFDGEFIRWGRYYRMAGYYTFQIAWLAWCFWFFTGIFFMLVPLYGAFFLTFTGLLMCLEVLIYGSLIQTVYSRIGSIFFPFEAGTMIPIFSWGFFVTLFVGVGTVIGGVALIVTMTLTKKKESIVFREADNEVELETKVKSPEPKPKPQQTYDANQGWQQQGYQQPQQQQQPVYQQQQQGYQGYQQQSYDVNNNNQPFVPPRPNMPPLKSAMKSNSPNVNDNVNFNA